MKALHRDPEEAADQHTQETGCSCTRRGCMWGVSCSDGVSRYSSCIDFRGLLGMHACMHYGRMDRLALHRVLTTCPCNRGTDATANNSFAHNAIIWYMSHPAPHPLGYGAVSELYHMVVMLLCREGRRSRSVSMQGRLWSTVRWGGVLRPCAGRMPGAGLQSNRQSQYSS
jgi:hypothetical protein